MNGNSTQTAAAQRHALWELLGGPPSKRQPPPVQSVAIEDRGGFLLEKLQLALNDREPVPAYLVRPHGAGPFPVVLYNHAHGGRYEIGKEELVDGRPALQDPPYAAPLTELGIAALCIDHYCFGDRRHNRESALFKELLWRGKVLWGEMVTDSVRAVDYLHTRDDIDVQRMGTMGLSMGSTMAWWLAALDPRISCCVDICCLTDFQTLLTAGGIDNHSIYYFVPGLLRRFTTTSINALIAPRPHLSLAGLRDPLTPAEGLRRIDAALQIVYAGHGAADHWRLVTEDVGHVETRRMRAEILTFLQRFLGNGAR